MAARTRAEGGSSGAGGGDGCPRVIDMLHFAFGPAARPHIRTHCLASSSDFPQLSNVCLARPTDEERGWLGPEAQTDPAQKGASADSSARIICLVCE